ncbi:Pentatricopeptide repeat superfamily protein [Rhynchospora pubera]|uniref:Pentatricopeptide repeat superfamily protein n=1 Tax=Rhynchospora pubera TaxID=906938 RepID=A0AAV8EY91_9POAL|nr:Pentatricopeptide repeat superfamily protein [Rhynchospora pubera]
MELYFSSISNCTCNHETNTRTQNFSNSPLFLLPSTRDFRNIRPFVGFNQILIAKRTEFWPLHCLLKPKPTPVRRPSVVDSKLVQEMVAPPAIRLDLTQLCDQLEYFVMLNDYKDALELFEQVPSCVKIRASTYDALINACIKVSSRRYAKMLVSRYLSEYVDIDSDSNFAANSEFDIYLYNRLIFLFVKCGLIHRAYRLFDAMPMRNATSFNMMLSGFASFGKYLEAINLFLSIWKRLPDKGPNIFVSVLRACAGLSIEYLGHQLHAIVVKKGYFDNNSFIFCALMDMYAKCACIKDAQKLFDFMPEKTITGWNTMIAGLAFNGLSEEALDLYNEMKSTAFGMDKFTYSIIIRVCARLGSIEQGKEAHAGLLQSGFGLDLVVGTALVDLYGKWGSMEDACSVFDQMPRKNVITWNALIGGYAYHGMGSKAIEMLNQMVKEGFVPNHVTLLAVLVACAYTGMLGKGRSIFENMQKDYNVKPRAMHYACMVDFLGREGLLQEALDLIEDSPCGPTRNMWAAFLRACCAHENLELGLYAAEKLCCMDPEKLSNYMVLLNLYLREGRTESAKKVMDTLTEKGLEISVPYTWIEVKKISYQFMVGDKSHPLSAHIYEKIGELMQELEKAVPIGEEVKFVLPDVMEGELTDRAHHSEKLAVAFGLIGTPEFTPLQLMQPHRICEHCHAFIEVVGLLTQRDIVIRDASRFHHFSEGKCSCNNYW